MRHIRNAVFTGNCGRIKRLSLPDSYCFLLPSRVASSRRLAQQQKINLVISAAALLVSAVFIALAFSLLQRCPQPLSSIPYCPAFGALFLTAVLFHILNFRPPKIQIRYSPHHFRFVYKLRLCFYLPSLLVAKSIPITAYRAAAQKQALRRAIHSRLLLQAYLSANAYLPRYRIAVPPPAEGCVQGHWA